MQNLKLNNGIEMPVIGLGVFQSPPKETEESVYTALTNGYRLIDTAASYMNESQVGAGLKRSGIKRSDVFLVTKLWISDYGTKETIKAFEASLRRLGTDYVDLYLLHQPMTNEFDKTISAYETMESVFKEGNARAIGVSNFNQIHLDKLLGNTSIPPAVNQIEVHPYFVQEELRKKHSELNIKTMAWSPLGGIHVYRPKDPNAVLNALKHPTILALAEKYKKTPAQIVLRWHIDIGNCAIPKSVREERIKENFDVFDFHLSSNEIAEINKLDTGVRAGPNPDLIDTKSFTLKINNDPDGDNAVRTY